MSRRVPFTDRVTRAQLAALADDRPDGGGHAAVLAPFTGEAIGEVPLGDEGDVERAMDRAREAAASWRDRPVDERAAVFERFADLVLDHRDELLDLLQIESGKARLDALEEVVGVVANATHYAERGPHLLGSERRHGAIPGLTRTEVHRGPVGVVGVIAPWNYPLTLAVSDAVPAMVAGDAVLLKPDAKTPYVALRAAELLSEAGLPEGVFQVLPGRGEVVGTALTDRADFIAFTGSTETGRSVAERAGRRLVDCSLELGGKNPMVVLSDAPLERAVTGAVRGCFANAGQLCLSVERVYVDEAVHDAFVDRFVERVEGLTLGTALDFSTDVGSLLSVEHLERVEEAVDGSRAEGATALTGGERRNDLGPAFYAPTILADVAPGASIDEEETFGPVVSVHPVGDVEAAIDRANATDYGLHASVWSGDAERGRSVARRIDAGTVAVNDAYVSAWGSVDAPMGGMGDSGIGRRHGDEGLLKYTVSKTIATQRGHPIAPPPWLPNRVFARGLTAGVRLLDRLPFR